MDGASRAGARGPHTAIHAVTPQHVATFLGRKLTGTYAGNLGSDFETRIQGTRITHVPGAVTPKLDDTFGDLRPSARRRDQRVGADAAAPTRDRGYCCFRYLSCRVYSLSSRSLPSKSA